MSSFAIILLSDTLFGGAQKRFLNLHRFYRRTYGNRAWFIVSASMKAEIISTYGADAADGIYALGEPSKAPSKATLQENKIKKTSFLHRILTYIGLIYLYTFLKSRKRAYAAFIQINQFAKENNIDRFLAVYNGVLPLYFYLNKKDKTKRIVFSNMDSWFSHFEKNPVKRILKQYTLFHRAHQECNHVDFLSPFILEGVKSRKYLPEEQKVSITACSFIDYSKCRIAHEKKIEFVFAGRLEKDKNPVLFLQAALNVSKKYPDIKFHILGKGRLSGKLEQILLKSGRTNIFIHGYLPEPCTLLAETAVFVSLQKDNNYPSQSVLEAMACGNAIIASDVGDTRLFINEENGWLINNSITQLTEAMKHCICNSEEVLKKGKFASTFVRERFTIEQAAAYYYSLLYPPVHEQGK